MRTATEKKLQQWHKNNPGFEQFQSGNTITLPYESNTVLTIKETYLQREGRFNRLFVEAIDEDETEYQIMVHSPKCIKVECSKVYQLFDGKWKR